VTVAPFSSDQVVVTPNPAIPAAGYATVQLTSSEAVVATLATGTRSGVALSPAQRPGTTFLLTDFTGAGYNTAAVTNTSSRPITVTFTKIGRSRHTNVTDTARLAGDSTSLILGLFSGLTSFRSATLLVTTSRPSLLVTATLPSSPVGVTVVSPLYGG